MHEYSLVQALLSRIADEARGRGALRVHAVKVRLGELSGVEPDLFTAAWEIARAGTPCAAAELRLDRITAVWSCPRCREVFPPGAVLRCAECREPAVLNDGADALTLEQLELEVP
jgi:hydrogenase nickel incorporation protein HypA/HybF